MATINYVLEDTLEVKNPNLDEINKIIKKVEYTIAAESVYGKKFTPINLGYNINVYDADTINEILSYFYKQNIYIEISGYRDDRHDIVAYYDSYTKNVIKYLKEYLSEENFMKNVISITSSNLQNHYRLFAALANIIYNIRWYIEEFGLIYKGRIKCLTNELDYYANESEFTVYIGSSSMVDRTEPIYTFKTME